MLILLPVPTRQSTCALGVNPTGLLCTAQLLLDAVGHSVLIVDDSAILKQLLLYA